MKKIRRSRAFMNSLLIEARKGRESKEIMVNGEYLTLCSRSLDKTLLNSTHKLKNDNRLFSAHLITNIPRHLDELASKHGTDKGGIADFSKHFSWQAHRYTDLYSLLFAPLRHQRLTLFECGIGSNNPSVPSNMTIHGRPGASLYMWRDFFPNAEIYGADVDADILFSDQRITTGYMNQLERLTIRSFWNECKEKAFDIMIDDGLHALAPSINLFEESIGYLKPNGMYLIEDVHDNDELSYREYFGKLSFNLTIFRFYNGSSRLLDDRLLLITRY